MPTEEENIQFAYLVLTNGGTPQIDWESIGKELNLKTGAITKRWSRLKQALDQGKPAGSEAMKLLWLMLAQRGTDKIDWKDIAAKCGTTVGAASKRFSRMKLALERGDACPGTPSGSKGKTTTNAAAPDSNADPEIPDLKRKRGPAAGKRGARAVKTGAMDKMKVKTEDEDEDGASNDATSAAADKDEEDEQVNTKKRKTTRSAAPAGPPLSNNTKAQTKATPTTAATTTKKPTLKANGNANAKGKTKATVTVTPVPEGFDESSFVTEPDDFYDMSTYVEVEEKQEEEWPLQESEYED